VRSPARLSLAFGCSLCALSTVLSAAAPARADPSAWLAASAGVMEWKQASALPPGPNPNGALSFDVGVGTSPDRPFIVGGIFRLAPIITQGSDLTLQMRLCNRGFQGGVFGAAIDLGGYYRFWGATSRGFAGGLTLGGPFGLQASIQTTLGTDSAVGFGVVAGIDLLRLSVFRRTSLKWWPNSTLPVRSASADGAALSF
jgi:hypothetical protein